VIAKVEAAFDATYNQWPTSLHYLAQSDGTAKLVHSIQVQNEEVNSWYEVYVDAHTGDILSATDFVAEAAVRILPKYKHANVLTMHLIVSCPPHH
jgi:extracellular elastinolytic metalloproteinase